MDSRKRKVVRGFFVLIVFVCMLWCLSYAWIWATQTPSNYKIAIVSAKEELSLVNNMVAKFPDVKITLSNYPNYYGEGPVLTCRKGLAKKFVVIMQVPVEVSFDGQRVSQRGKPYYSFLEVESIKRMPDGRYYTIFSNRGRELTISEWNAMLNSNGEFITHDISTKDVSAESWFTEATGL